LRHAIVYLARRPDQPDADLREPETWRSSHLVKQHLLL
jgi:hypothetical protein